jgi:transposase
MISRNVKIDIVESLEVLEGLYKSMKNSKLKERLHALYLLKANKVSTISDLEDVLLRDRSTISLWFRKYREGGLSKYLELEKIPGRPFSIPEEIKEKLIEILSDPVKGFHSYKEAREWLKKEFNLDMPYSTLYNYIKYKLKAKLKIQRPFNIKRDEVAVEEFKEKFQGELNKINLFINQESDKELKIFFQDESRFGLITNLGRKLTLRGIKPIGLHQFVFQNTYYYGAIEPLNGDSFFSEFSSLNTKHFQDFLNNFSQKFKDTHNVLVLDNARFHSAKALKVPENVSFIFLPPYSPDLNPIERLWQDIKKPIKSKIFNSLQNLMDEVSEILDKITNDSIKNISQYDYIMNAVKLTY